MGSPRIRGLLLALLMLTPLAFFPGVLTGRSIGADDHRSVHHAFQSEAGGRVHNPALSDPVLQFQGLTQAVVSELKAGRAPLWNPQIFAGAPLLADAQSRPASPWTWLHLLLPMRWAQTLGSLLTIGAFGAGTFLLARRLGWSWGGALVSGLAAQATPGLQVWLLHPHATTLVFLPWLLLAIEHQRTTERGLPLVLVVAGVLCGGHPETAAHVLVGGALFWGVRGPTIQAVGATVLGALIAAPIWLPFADLAMDSATLDAHGGNRLLLNQLQDLLWPNLAGHPAREDFGGPGVWADGVLNPGVPTLLLALMGLTRAKGRWLWAIYAGTLGLALLPVPVLNCARLGSHGAWLLAMAAGIGVERVLERAGEKQTLALAAVGLTTLAGGLHARLWDQTTHEVTLAPAEWTQVLAERASGGRVVGIDWALQPNTGMLVGLSDVRGYDLPVQRSTERFMAALNPQLRRPWFPVESVNAQNRQLLEFAAVRYVLAPQALYGLAPVDLGVPTPLEVYALDDDAPRAWVATGARPAANERESLDFLRAGYASRGTPPVEDLGRRLSEDGQVHPVTLVDQGRRVLIELPAETPDGLLVLADRYDRDWEVQVDGEPAELLRVAGLFRGVLVPPGAQQVRFDYRPWSWAWGWVLFGFGLVGSAGMAWRQRGRS
ncbi:MAG: hypothetical protein VX899_13250 [Myxococcota bacterium]|nr:hypothetical protein [Myxococcota bacterium]